MDIHGAFGTIADLAPGDHVCFIYDEPGTALALGAQVLARGLGRHGYAICVAGEHPTERVEAALASQGVDVLSERQHGALVIRSTWREVFPTGDLTPEGMAAFIVTLIDEARARGFSEIWAVADLTWAMRINVPHEHLMRYEALLYQAFTRNPIVGICTYNRRSLRPAELRRALHVHPLALLEDIIYPNIYYETPDPALDERTAAAEVETMLAQIARALRTEQEHAQLLQERAAHIGADAARQQLQEFVAMVAHDLASPLTSVMGYTQLLRWHAERLRGADTSALARREREALVRLENATGRIRRLADDLRLAARIGAGHFTVQPATMDLAAVARQVAVELQATTKRHRIVVDAPVRLEGHWDRDRLTQLLTNLVSNAIRYSPDGGTIKIGVSRRADQVAISVQDEGIGISREQVDRLFQAFTRIRPDQHAQGLGLGLYIARAIAEGHGGRIWVESEPGTGSTFTATLPLGNQAAEDERNTGEQNPRGPTVA